MKIKQTIGIDISKLTFDVRIHSNQVYAAFDNDTKGFRKMIKWVNKNNTFSEDETLYIFEHTGLYSHQLAVFLTEQQILFALVPGLAVKRSLGICRGKDDKIDAKKLAKYAYEKREDIQAYDMPSEQINSLKHLLSLRGRLVKQRAGYKVCLNEQKRVLIKKKNVVLFDSQEKLIKYLTKQIDAIEKEMDDIVNKSDSLKAIYDLITSIKSVGPQTALFTMVYTNVFTKFSTWRKFASYVGTAPFPNSSGTSLRGKTKVSNLAYKKIKSLLDQCAKSAIQHNPEMRIFYQRRIEEGKNEMSTINIIRNKILARIFAVVKRGTPYINTMKYAT